MREQKEEEERKLIDIEEAKFQQAQRKEAIEKAKTQQYYQTDRVKGFHVSEIYLKLHPQFHINLRYNNVNLINFTTCSTSIE